VVLNINRDCLQQITDVLHTEKMDRKQSLKQNQKQWGRAKEERKETVALHFLVLFLLSSDLVLYYC